MHGQIVVGGLMTTNDCRPGITGDGEKIEPTLHCSGTHVKQLTQQQWPNKNNNNTTSRSIIKSQ